MIKRKNDAFFSSIPKAIIDYDDLKEPPETFDRTVIQNRVPKPYYYLDPKTLEPKFSTRYDDEYKLWQWKLWYFKKLKSNDIKFSKEQFITFMNDNVINPKWNEGVGEGGTGQEEEESGSEPQSEFPRA